MMDIKLTIPSLETECLILREWRESDLEGFHRIWADEENAKFIGGVKTRSETWRMIATIIGHWGLKGFGPFSIEEKASSECIGWVGPWCPEGWPEPEIAYSLAPSTHGKGYATEAARAALSFAYKQLGWTTAMSLIDRDNDASSGVAKKLGATLESEGASITNFIADIWRYPSSKEFLEIYA